MLEVMGQVYLALTYLQQSNPGPQMLPLQHLLSGGLQPYGQHVFVSGQQPPRSAWLADFYL